MERPTDDQLDEDLQRIITPAGKRLGQSRKDSDMTMQPPDHIDIVFDGAPGPGKPGQFVEVEDSQGRSIRVGEWLHRDDGYWVLRIPDPRPESPEWSWLDRTSDE